VAKQKKEDDDKRPIIIIKKVKKVEGGHHGGAWKVAYADFVTAMMAFFLLLWLLSVTTSVQKQKIADYFAPTDPSISTSDNGSNGMLAGKSVATEGAMTDSTVNDTDQMDSPEDKKKDADLDKADDKAFKSVEENIRQSLESVPELKELMPNLLIDMTPEGLRIQIIDQEGKPMFALGSPAPLPQTVKLLSMITNVIKDLPNKISIRGHTDSKAYGKDANYTNWELSADRSNASRRVMLSSGLDSVKIENVQGKADREPLVTTDPASARNRRISIILLKQSVVAGAKRAEENFKKQQPNSGTKPEPKKHDEGVIYFP
jgi:chemotaxis protein MotB